MQSGLNIICNADDIAGSEDERQNIVFRFNKSCKLFNIKKRQQRKLKPWLH